MQTMIRHLGIPVQSRAKAIEFWEKMGLSVVNLSNEEWDGRKLSIAKMGDVHGGQIELIKGSWPYHVAIGMDEFPSGLEMIHFKRLEDKRLEVGFFRVPDSGIVEIVRVI